nr:hypothetical protein [Tanacetum cinerariifolium]
MERPFFWVDAFACPTSFPWHTIKSVSRDAIPKSSEFNAKHYAILVAYPAPCHKYPEPFLCLVGMSQMDLLSFIRTADPIKVRISERQRGEDEPKILETTVGHVVLLLPAEQGHSTNSEQGVGIQLVSRGEEVVDEDTTPLQPRRQKKQKIADIDASELSHLVKRLRDDHEILGRTSIDSSHHYGANIAEAEVDSFASPSVSLLDENAAAVEEMKKLL